MGRINCILSRAQHEKSFIISRPDISIPLSYKYEPSYGLNRGSYMSVHVLLNLLNELRKRDKMRGLPSILSLFHNSFNKFNNSRA